MRSLALSFDIEDGISLSMRDNFNTIVPQTNRVVRCTEQILEMLSENGSLGTFFILGQVAEKFPDLINKIADAGHEIGVHGYDHYTLNRLKQEEAYSEVYRTKMILEDISGKEVFGHRAPAFSVTEQTSWMFDVLVDAGFRYDSSILPASLGAFRWPEFGDSIKEVVTSKGSSIIEVPVSIFSINKLKLPFSGGSYLRILPQSFINYLFEQHIKKYPIIHYMHPYEIDQEAYPDFYFDALTKSSVKKSLKMRSYWYNRSTLPAKLRMLSQNFTTVTINDLIHEIDLKAVFRI